MSTCLRPPPPPVSISLSASSLPPSSALLPCEQPFHNVCDLVPLAETVSKLSAICHICQEEAAYSKRLSDDMAAIVIGGTDTYIPTCRPCFFDDLASMSILNASTASAVSSDSGAGSSDSDDAEALKALDVDAE